MGWFRRHLNLTLGLIASPWQVFYCFAPSEFVLPVKSLLFAIHILIILLTRWVLVQKRQSGWLALLAIIPFGWLVGIVTKSNTNTNAVKVTTIPPEAKSSIE